jgi:hypothetical protein
MRADWTWTSVSQAVVGVVQWTLAIVSIGGTLALFSWILVMVVKKDKPK